MGNISNDSALSLCESCLNIFSSSKSSEFLHPSEYLILKTTKIPKDSAEIFQSILTDPANTNSAAISQYQIGPETLKFECLIQLIENYLEEPCFDTLRTKEQLGYVVSSYSHKMRGMMNFMILIQSSTHCPAQIFERIFEFLKTMKIEIKKITDKEFGKLVKATIESALKKDLSLQEEYQRLKFEVDSAAYIFNRKQILKKIIKDITKDEFLQAFEEVFSENGRRLDIALVSHNMLQQENELQKNRKNFISSFSQFKRTHSVWPQVYIRTRNKNNS